MSPTHLSRLFKGDAARAVGDSTFVPFDIERPMGLRSDPLERYLCYRSWVYFFPGIVAYTLHLVKLLSNFYYILSLTFN